MHTLVLCGHRLLLGLSCSDISQDLEQERKKYSPSSSVGTSSISTSLAGVSLGLEASSSSLAESRFCLAVSIGPKTFFLSLWLLDFLELALELFAILTISPGQAGSRLAG